MHAIAVIGANYGDEGKGRIVDYLASRNTLVVRHNGGAQAGHTVVRDGKRHVFSHFGSGTFKRAPTFLGPEFVTNPMNFKREYLTLEALDEVPSCVYIDPRCRITTPYEVIVNQEIESARGEDRHGSCGVGFHETVLRHQNHPFMLCKPARSDEYEVRQYLLKARTHALDRLKSYSIWKGFTTVSEGVFLSPDLIDQFIHDLTFMLMNVVMEPLSRIAPQEVIFEGAQGLGLDEFYGTFPYVTHSRTGLTNVARILQEVGGAESVEAIFVTRPYATRHGAGPLPDETNQMLGVDVTNVENPWQGKLRYAELNISQMLRRVRLDVANSKLNPSVSFAVTHAEPSTQGLITTLQDQDPLRILVSSAAEGEIRCV